MIPLLKNRFLPLYSVFMFWSLASARFSLTLLHSLTLLPRRACLCPVPYGNLLSSCLTWFLISCMTRISELFKSVHCYKRIYWTCRKLLITGRPARLLNLPISEELHLHAGPFQYHGIGIWSTQSHVSARSLRSPCWSGWTSCTSQKCQGGWF